MAEKLRNVFARHAQRVALVDCAGGRQFTYAELKELASKTAARLSQAVRLLYLRALFFGNSAEMIVSYLACVQLGAISIPVNPSFSDQEISGILSACRPSTVVTDDS